MAAAAADGDLGAHLQDLADDGRLLDFLDQTGDAITLAQGDQTFAEQLDPLLGRIRDALAEFPTDQLSRVERDAVESTRQALDAHLGPVDPPTETGEVPGGGSKRTKKPAATGSSATSAGPSKIGRATGRERGGQDV